MGRACLAAAHALCHAALHDRPFDADAEVRRLRSLAQRIGLGPSTAALADAARRRGIPVRRLGEYSLLQLGHGARQRRVWTAESDRTGVIAEQIAQDKELTRFLLYSVGVPVPEGRPVSDADDAWEAAEDLGGPVVVKPRDGNHGRGVATNLTTRAQVLAAYANARDEGQEVLVERFAPGDDYRLLVVGGRLVAAARRDPAHVVGDGISTIIQLVERENEDPRRGEDHATALSKMEIGPIALGVLREQGFTPESVPPAGVRVLIRRNANLSTGGTATDVTDLVHPEVAARAVEAAQAVGLDIAGIDVVATDISQPLEEQGGIIVEVNAGPGLRMHLEPSHGTPRPVGQAIIDMLFPDGQNGRIPIVGVTGVNGKTTTTRLIAHIFRSGGRHVGMACTDGIHVDGRQIETGDCAGPASAEKVLLNPRVEAAVLETDRGGVLRAGLGFDRCDVAVVTNIGEGDHLGLDGIETLEELAEVKRILVTAVAPGGSAVLNADDPPVAAMASSCAGSVVFFSRKGAEESILMSHRSDGGRAVLVRDGWIVLANGADEVPFVSLANVPLTLGGRIGFQVENVLAAVAAAWVSGLSLETIRRGLATFHADEHHIPGRFNMLEAHGATVVVDQGNNLSALSSLIESFNLFPHRRRAVVYTVAGDRRDEDIVRQGHVLGESFDRIVLHEDDSARGRVDGEIIALMRQGLAAGSRVAEVIETRGERRAIELALRGLRSGDLLLVRPDDIRETLAQVRSWCESEVPAREEYEEAILCATQALD